MEVCDFVLRRYHLSTWLTSDLWYSQRCSFSFYVRPLACSSDRQHVDNVWSVLAQISQLINLLFCDINRVEFGLGLHPEPQLMDNSMVLI